MCDLSILIPSLHSRLAPRHTLLQQLRTQPSDLLARCQVLVDIDDGQTSIGAKRNRLLAASVGRYVVFIDDDDGITDDYLTELFIGIDRGVDHVGVGMMYRPTSGRAIPVECALRHEWTFDGTKYLRPPQHVCAVRRELARAVGFPDISFGEDRHYAEALKSLVMSEYVVGHPIYDYYDMEVK